MERPYFCILIPAYNQVGKMDKCFNSLISQEFKDFEVITVNDGSTDETLEMLNEFAEKDSRFSVCSYEKNGSLVKARYEGMKRARGKYVLFLDSDDSYEDGALTAIHDFLEKKSVDILRFGFTAVPDNFEMLPEESDDPLKDIMEERIPPAIWKNCFSGDLIRRAVEKISPFYCNMGEDSYFATLFFSLAETTDILAKPLYIYDLGTGMSSLGGSVSTAKLLRDLDSVHESSEHILDFLIYNNSEYLEMAKKHLRLMHRYVLIEAVLYEEDMKKAVDNATAINNEKYKELYEFACNKLLPYKVKSEKLKGGEALKDKWSKEFLQLMTED